MNQQLRQLLEGRLKSQEGSLGVKFTKLEIHSAAAELGLLEQIEINYPSKLVKSKVHVSHPDPSNPMNMIQTTVDREYRRHMTDAEVLRFHQEQAEQRVLDYYTQHPEKIDEFLAQVQKPAKPA